MHKERTLLYLPPRLLQPGDRARGTNTAALQELAASIRQVGILQPLTVRKAGSSYVVISGNRRLMAARMAGLTELPCLLPDRPELDPVLIALTENLQREDLHYFREAELLQTYLDQSGLSQGQAARRLGRSQSAVANKLRLLRHPPAVRQALTELGLSERHARALLRIPGQERQLFVLREIAANQLTVAQTEQYIDVFLQNGAAPARKLRERDARLLLRRMERDAEALHGDLEARDSPEALVLTLRIPK